MSEEQKALALTTRTELKNVLITYLTWTESEITQALAERKLPVIDMMILQALENGMKSGSTLTADWILDHVLGKQTPKAEIKMTGNSLDLSKLSTEQLTALETILKTGKE